MAESKPNAIDQSPAPSSRSVSGESESAMTPMSPSMATLPSPILYACIVRHGCSCCQDSSNDETLLLAHGGAERLGQKDINYTALNLLEQKINLGWDSFDPKPKFRRRRGLKFHVYQERRGCNGSSIVSKVQIYVYACVYDTKRCNRALAQAFLINLVEATQEFRLSDKDWMNANEMLACQKSCGPLLQKHLDEVALLWGSQLMQPASPSAGTASRSAETETPSPKLRIKPAITSNAMNMARDITLQNRNVMSSHTDNMSLPATPSSMTILVPTNSPSTTLEACDASTTVGSPEQVSVQVHDETEAADSPALLTTVASPEQVLVQAQDVTHAVDSPVLLTNVAIPERESAQTEHVPEAVDSPVLLTTSAMPERVSPQTEHVPEAVDSPFLLTTVATPERVSVQTDSVTEPVDSPILLAQQQQENTDFNAFSLSPRSVVGSPSTSQPTVGKNDNELEQLDDGCTISATKEVQAIVKDVKPFNDFSPLNTNFWAQPLRQWWWLLTLGATSSANANNSSLCKEPPKRTSTSGTEQDTTSHEDDARMKQAEHPCSCIPSLFAPRTSLID